MEKAYIKMKKAYEYQEHSKYIYSYKYEHY